VDQEHVDGLHQGLWLWLARLEHQPEQDHVIEQKQGDNDSDAHGIPVTGASRIV
jgi:hypothetical protein